MYPYQITRTKQKYLQWNVIAIRYQVWFFAQFRILSPLDKDYMPCHSMPSTLYSWPTTYPRKSFEFGTRERILRGFIGRNQERKRTLQSPLIEEFDPIKRGGLCVHSSAMHASCRLPGLACKFPCWHTEFERSIGDTVFSVVWQRTDGMSSPHPVKVYLVPLYCNEYVWAYLFKAWSGELPLKIWFG